MELIANIGVPLFFADIETLYSANLQPGTPGQEQTDWNANDIAWNAMDWHLNDGETQ